MAIAWQATAAEAPILARMLDDFNVEFEDPSPGVAVLEPRVARLIAEGVKEYFLAAVDDDPEPIGFVQLSFIRSVWKEEPIAHVDELYVVPASRGRGAGRALMEAVVARARERRAPGIEVVTGEDDTEARRLYESCGFVNEIEGPDNARALFYELDLR